MLKLLILFLLLTVPVLTLNITPIAKDIKESQFLNTTKTYFGEQLFKGNFKRNSQSQQDPNYLLKPGDVVSIKIWGAHTFSNDLTIDKQGNIFIPEVGTAQLAGLKNKDLQAELANALKEVFNDNVQMYALLQGYQPLSVFVSGSVKNVGLYHGFSTDSILQFIDKAGGIISGEGSFRHIVILRDNSVIKTIDLYNFLLHGQTSHFPFQEGDVVLVKPMKNFIEVTGEVNRPYIFEILSPNTSVSSILKYVLPKSGVNQFIHTKRRNQKESSNTYPLSKAKQVRMQRGDKLNFFSNQYVNSIAIAIEGEHKGLRHLSVKKGTSLYDILNKAKFSTLSNIQNIQLFRKSVQSVQKNLLLSKLKDLEARALTSDASSAEEATIRSKEASLILQFIARAKQIEPKGQIVLSSREDLRHIILEKDDRLFIPKKNNVVVVQGEVNIPNALTFKQGKNISYYIHACGGYTDRANQKKVLLVKSNGKVIQYNDFFNFSSPQVEAGDSLLILGKTDTKNVLLAKDISQILYQIAVGAAVVLKAF